MHLKKLAAAVAVASMFAAAQPASAVVLQSSSLASGNTVADFSADGLVSFDLDLTRPLLPSALTFEVTAGDLGGPLAFNAIVRNLSLDGIADFKLFIDDAVFSVLGTADGFAGFATVRGGPSAAQLVFNPPEFTDFAIGNPTGLTPGAVDWQISIAGLTAGDTLTLTMQAPTPATLPLLLAGLGIAGFARTRKR